MPISTTTSGNQVIKRAKDQKAGKESAMKTEKKAPKAKKTAKKAVKKASKKKAY